MLNHAISDAVLAAASIFACYQVIRAAAHNGGTRLRWHAVYFALLALAATAGAIRFAGLDQLAGLHKQLSSIGGSVGAIALAVGWWLPSPGRAIIASLVTAAVAIALIPVAGPLAQGLAIVALLIKAVVRASSNPLLLTGILTAIVAVLYRKLVPMDAALHPIDGFHYVLALSTVLLAMASRQLQPAHDRA